MGFLTHGAQEPQGTGRQVQSGAWWPKHCDTQGAMRPAAWPAGLRMPASRKNFLRAILRVGVASNWATPMNLARAMDRCSWNGLRNRPLSDEQTEDQTCTLSAEVPPGLNSSWIYDKQWLHRWLVWDRALSGPLGCSPGMGLCLPLGLSSTDPNRPF